MTELSLIRLLFTYHVYIYGFSIIYIFIVIIIIIIIWGVKTHFVDQAGLELSNPHASVSQVLGLKACAPMPGLFILLLKISLSPWWLDRMHGII